MDIPESIGSTDGYVALVDLDLEHNETDRDRVVTLMRRGEELGLKRVQQDVSAFFVVVPPGPEAAGTIVQLEAEARALYEAGDIAHVSARAPQ
jgi:hypothetical protein